MSRVLRIDEQHLPETAKSQSEMHVRERVYLKSLTCTPLRLSADDASALALYHLPGVSLLLQILRMRIARRSLAFGYLKTLSVSREGMGADSLLDIDNFQIQVLCH